MPPRATRETMLYTGPVTGRVWQLNGQGQENHPVTLMPSPKGLYGTGVKVHSREIPRSRTRKRVAVVPEPLNLELVFDIKAETPALTRRVFEQFKEDWPLTGNRHGQLPPTGLLSFNSGRSEWKYLDVYRTERFENMLGKSPMALGKAKLMVVACAEDPFPYGDYEPLEVKVSGSNMAQGVLRNDGQVPTSPTVHWDGPAATLRFGGDVDFTAQVNGEALFDLSPNELTITESRGVRPIITTWNQQPWLTVPAGGTAKLNLSSNRSGKFTVHMPPRWEELY